jgi:hypothetical protein
VFRRPASPSLPTHWSKDFVEHLRTVHFALIVVSTGLLLLAFSSKSYNARTAYREIDEILKLQHVWSPDWILQHCTNTPRGNDPFAPAEGPFPASRYPPFGIWITKQRIGNAENQWPATVRWRDKRRAKEFMFAFPHKGWGCWEKGWRPRPTDESIEPPPFPTFPTTLSDFGKWWNGMAVTHTFVIPDGVSDSGILLIDSLGAAEGDTFMEYVPLDRSRWKDLEKVELFMTYDWVKEPEALMPWPIYGLHQGPRQPFPFMFQGELSSSESVVIPVATYREVEVDQQELGKFFSGWRVAAFDKSFRDLTQAAHGLEALDFEDVRKVMSEEATKGDEIFEAFGMRFPAGQITFWGSVVLLSVQLYLFSYLKQLSGRLDSGDPCWDVPWIGMNDQSRLGRIIFFVTLVVLPCFAMGLLLLRSTSLMTAEYWTQTGSYWHIVLSRPTHWNWRVVLKILGAIATFVFALVLAALSWRCRPRVEREPEPRCSPQLFE